MQEFLGNLLIYVLFYEYCAFVCKLYDRRLFEVECAKLHHRVISEELSVAQR